MQVTLAQINEMLAVIKKQQLRVHPEFKLATPEDLLEIWNGIGADSWPPALREALGIVLEYFLPATLPHDWDFAKLSVQPCNFDDSNERLYINCRILARNKFPAWYQSLQRWRYYLRARGVWVAVQKFGWEAWLGR